MKKATISAALDAVTVTTTPADTTAADTTTTTTDAQTAQTAPELDAPVFCTECTAPNRMPQVVAVSLNPRRVLDPVTITEADGTTKQYIFVTPANRAALEVIAHELDRQRDGKKPDFLRLVSLLHVVHHHDTKESKSKLAGLDSISTCCLDNPLCEALRKIPGSICQKCYAATQQSRQPELSERNIINGLVLRNFLIPRKYFALLHFAPLATYRRVESFGDVANVTQARNYCRIITAHKAARFGVWSKHEGIYKAAFKAEGGQPKNASFVYSSVFVDTPAPLPDGFDHVFTAYHPATITAEGIEINCGGRRCADCIRAKKGCYFKASARNPVEIREQLKEPEQVIYTV